MAVHRGDGAKLPFHCVSTMKLSLLSFFSLGLYELVWFYKNWALVSARSEHKFSPQWRALFSPVFCLSFAREVNSTAESVGVAQRTRPWLIAVTYAGLILLLRLPDPYWLICLFSFVPLIPVARQIRAIHEAVRPGHESAVGWGGWSYTTLVVGGLLIVLAVIGAFALPIQALRDSEIPSSYTVTLVEAGVLEPEEELQFFYSAGLFSILEDGNLLTDERVVSYETVDGELYVASSLYEGVRSIDVEYSETIFMDTHLTVSTVSGEEFLLFVSAEEGRDREFVSYLQNRGQAAQSASPEVP